VGAEGDPLEKKKDVDMGRRVRRRGGGVCFFE